MPDQKVDNLLNLSMDATPKEREKSENLNVGYDPKTRRWDVIVKYSGPESGLAGVGIEVVSLLGGYAIVTLPESEIDAYSNREQIEFIEKPKRLYFETFRGEGRRAAYCQCRHGDDGLTGEGDSGWALWILEWIIFTRISEMRMAAAGSCDCGIRVYTEIHRKAM